MELTKGNMVKELIVFYRNYKFAKVCLEHYETEKTALERELKHGAPIDISAMAFDTQPHGAAWHPNFEANAQKYLELGQKIENAKSEIELYDTTFDRFHQIFKQYNARKYSVLVMRINGKTNKEIASELGLSPERVRHIVTELNKEYGKFDIDLLEDQNHETI